MLHRKYLSGDKKNEIFKIIFSSYSIENAFLSPTNLVYRTSTSTSSFTKPVGTHDFALRDKKKRMNEVGYSLRPWREKVQLNIRHSQPRTNHFFESTMSHIIQFSIVHTVRITFEVSWGTKVSVTWHFNGRLYTDEVGWEPGPYVEGVRRWTHGTGETRSLSLFLLVIEVPLSRTWFPFHDLTTSVTPIAPGEHRRSNDLWY